MNISKLWRDDYQRKIVVKTVHFPFHQICLPRHSIRTNAVVNEHTTFVNCFFFQQTK